MQHWSKNSQLPGPITSAASFIPALVSGSIQHVPIADERFQDNVELEACHAEPAGELTIFRLGVVVCLVLSGLLEHPALDGKLRDAAHPSAENRRDGAPSRLGAVMGPFI